MPENFDDDLFEDASSTKIETSDNDSSNTENKHEDLVEPNGEEIPASSDEATAQANGEEASNNGEVQGQKYENYQKADSGRSAFARKLENGSDYYKNKLSKNEDMLKKARAQADMDKKKVQDNKDKKNRNGQVGKSGQNKENKGAANSTGDLGSDNKKELKDQKKQEKADKKQAKASAKNAKDLAKENKLIKKDAKKAKKFEALHPVEAAKMRLKQFFIKVILPKLLLVLAILLFLFFVAFLIMVVIYAIFGEKGVREGSYVSSEFYSTNCVGNIKQSILGELKLPVDISGTVNFSSESGYGISDGNNANITSLDGFLFIGDSRYSTISSYISGLGSNVVVEGVGGSTSGHWIEVSKEGKGLVGSTVSGAERNVTLPSSATGISIMLGVNGTNVNVDSEKNDLITVLNNLHVRYPNVPIFVNSVYHWGSKYPKTYNDRVDEFNQKIKDYCNSNNWVTYVDITSGLHDDKGFLKSPFAADSLHINSSEGISKLTGNIKSAITGGATSSALKHNGLDLNSTTAGVTEGANVYSVMDGKVVESTADNTYSGTVNGGWVKIKYDFTSGNEKNTFSIIYGGLSIDSLTLKKGDEVKKGDVIGKIGSKEESEDGKIASLHFGYYDETSNMYMDPTNMFIPCSTAVTGDQMPIHDIYSISENNYVTAVKKYCESNTCSEYLKSWDLNTVYKTAVANNLNPRFVVLRAIDEGFAPHYRCSNNNYWGIAVYNTTGGCGTSYSSLADGVKGLANLEIVKDASTVFDLMKKYAYLGDYWYDGTDNWGLGGCTFYPYIKEYMTDQAHSNEVASWCNSGTGSSHRTTEDDQAAYTKFLCSKMTKNDEAIFGPYLISQSTPNNLSTNIVETNGILLWPAPSCVRITSGYGNRDRPADGASSDHRAIDIGCPNGSSVTAAAAGTVTTVKDSTNSQDWVSKSGTFYKWKYL